MTTIGYVTMPVIPSLDGVSAAIQRQLGFLPQLGRNAGQSLGDGLASGVDAAARKVETATGKITAANKKVEDSAGKVRVAEAQLQSLRDRGITDAGKLAAAEERVAAAQRNLQAASTGATRATNALERAQEELARAQTRANEAQNEGASSGSRFSGVLGQMGQKAGGAVGNLKNFAVAAAGIGSAMEIATTAMDFESVTAKMNASLGATGSLAEEYGKSAASLYGKGFGDSLGDVTSAIEAVATTMPVIGSEGEVSLDKAAERAMNLANAFGIDVAEGVQTAEQLITNGLAKDSTEAMDMLAAAMQRVPAAMRGELPEVLNEYGKHFQTFGLSGEAAMGLIVDMAPQGKIALDKTGDAIKELSIRATDGSKSTTAAFQAIKVDGDKMASAIAQGGPGAQAAMQEIAKGLMTIQDPAARAQQAIALFGTPLEDLGVDKIPQFLSALSGTSGSMADFQGTIDGVGETLGDTSEAKLKAFGRSLQTEVIGALGSAAGFLTEHKGLLYALGGALGAAALAYGTFRAAAVASSVAQGISAAATGAGTAAINANKLAMGAHLVATGAIKGATVAWTGVQWLLNAALNANPIGLIVIGIAALVAGIVLAYKNSETFRDIVAGAWNWIKDAALSVVSWFTDTAWPFLQRVGDQIGEKWKWLVAVAQEVWDGIKDKFNGMVDFVTSLPGKIKSAASGMWDGIRDAFKGAINWIIRAWNSLEFKIPGFKVGPIGYDGFTLGVPDLPEFFSGGHTGPGSKYQVAGVVHADEFVLSKRARGMLESAAPGGLDYMNQTGRWPGYAEGGLVGYGMPTGTQISYGQSDKFPEWVRALEQKFGVKASTYPGHQESDRGEAGYAPNPERLNRGIDFSGSTDQLQALADFLRSIASSTPTLEQIIWQNPSTGKRIGWAGRNDVSDTGYFSSDYAGHQDHVHLRASGPVGAAPAAPAADDKQQTPAQVAAAATDDKKTSDEKPQTSTPAPSSGGGGSYPTSISGWAGFIGENFVGGQIKSLLSVFGIPDSPSWMKAGSQLIGGIKVADKDGKSLFDGSNPLAGITGAIDGKQQTPAETPAKKADDSTTGPGAALPLTGQQAAPAPKATETLTSTLSAPKADYKGGSQATYDAVYKAYRDAGFADAMWADYVQMVNRESAWNPEARNPSSGAYGLAQFLGKGNVDKYLGGSSSGVPVEVQAKGMMQYIKDRYGDPSKAWEFWQKNNWYAEGGHTGPGSKYQVAGIVHADEFVMSKAARGSIESKAPGLLDYMNATGNVPGYADGGGVGLPNRQLDWTGLARKGLDVAAAALQGQTGKSMPAGGQVVYNIQARDTEDAFIRAQRVERERAAAKLSRF